MAKTSKKKRKEEISPAEAYYYLVREDFNNTKYTIDSITKEAVKAYPNEDFIPKKEPYFDWVMNFVRKHKKLPGEEFCNIQVIAVVNAARRRGLLDELDELLGYKK
jgi:hypothetical protein